MAKEHKEPKDPPSDDASPPKEKEKKEESSGADKAKRIAAKAGGGLAGLVAEQLSPVPAYALMKGTESALGVVPTGSSAAHNKLRKTIGKEMDAGQYNYHKGRDPGFGLDARLGGKTRYRPAIHGSPADPEGTMAHEFGHLRNARGMGYAPYAVTQGLTRALSQISGPAAAIYSGSAEDPSYTPGLVHLGISSPALLDEALASARAAVAMMGRHGAMGGLRHSLHLAPAFGTYASRALAPLGIAWARKKYKAHKEKKKEKEGKKAKNYERGKKAAFEAFGLPPQE